MKNMSIEEKAKEYRRKFESGFILEITERDKIELAFISGYNEATRWRDVEVELPQYDFPVFVRLRTDYRNETVIAYSVDYFSGKNKQWEQSHMLGVDVTHWLPIEHLH